MKTDEHRAEMDRRRERRRERAARAKALAARSHPTPRRETTDVEAVKSAKQKRDRRATRRIFETAFGGWK